MAVPTRYILAALSFAIAALGLMLLPVEASADQGGYGCRQHCSPPPPPPPPSGCHHGCRPPTVVVPPPHVPPPNIVVVNAGARAQAQASATAIAIANASTGDTIIRQNMIMQGDASATVQSSAFAVTEQSFEMETVSRERRLLIQAICLDANGNPHPASQTFGGQDIPESFRGEIYRCVAGTRMRYTVDGQNTDCGAEQALWYENGRVECRPQIARRPCNERSLLRRHGPGDKYATIRDTETRQARRETTFNGAMTMDGGVGATVW